MQYMTSEEITILAGKYATDILKKTNNKAEAMMVASLTSNIVEYSVAERCKQLKEGEK